MDEIVEAFANQFLKLIAGHGKERVITERHVAICVNDADAFDDSIEDDLEVGLDFPRNTFKLLG